MILFETKRLIVRNLKGIDIDGFYDMQGNPNVMRHIKKTMNLTESKAELNRFIGYYHNKEVYFNIWAIEEKIDKTFVGICGVYKNQMSEFEIAYRLREKFWKKGIGGEIAKELIAYCFKNLKIDELTAYVHKENKGSVHILEREMVFQKEFYSKKDKCKERMYILRKENWQLP